LSDGSNPDFYIFSSRPITPDDLDRHLSVDTYATHKTPVGKRWLKTHTRFHAQQRHYKIAGQPQRQTLPPDPPAEIREKVARAQALESQH
jgi:hypothetical protein